MSACSNGHQNPEGQNFCGECGLRLRASTQTDEQPQRVLGSDARPGDVRVGDGVQVIDRTNLYNGKIGIVRETTEGSDTVKVGFFGGRVTDSFRRETLMAVEVSAAFRQSFTQQTGETGLAVCINGHYDPDYYVDGGDKCRYCGERLKVGPIRRRYRPGGRP